MPVGVQCPLSFSLGEFPSYWDWLWCPLLSPILCPSPFPSPSILDVFHSLFLPSDFNCVSSLRPTYRHPFGRPFTYLLLKVIFQAWDWLRYPMLGFRRQNSGAHGAKNSIQISALAGVEPRTLASSAADVATRLPRTPPFSRLLRHAGRYSRTILPPKLQGLELCTCLLGWSLFANLHGVNLLPFQ